MAIRFILSEEAGIGTGRDVAPALWIEDMGGTGFGLPLPLLEKAA